MAMYANFPLPDLQQVQPPAPTEPLVIGDAEIVPEACGNFQLIIKGVPSGSYPSQAKARDGLAIYKRMGLVS